MMEGAQSDFYLSQAYSPALIAGRGYGKTIALASKAYNYAVQNPKGRGVLTQPSFDMIRRNFLPIWDNLFGRFSPEVWEYRVVLQGTPQEIAFKNGFIYDLRPATNEMAEKFRGATYCVAGMDELRNEDQLLCYLALYGAVRMPGYPLQFFVTSTPEARRPWIKQIWTDHVDPVSQEPLSPEDYPKFTARMEDNWHLSVAQKKRMRTMYGGQSRYARQELDAEDVGLEGIAFEEFRKAIHVRAPPEDTVFTRKLISIDFGATSPTSMHLHCLDQSNRDWITREFYKRNADDYDWVRTAVEWTEEEGMSSILIVCDPSRSEKELQELRRKYGLNIRRARTKRFDDRVRLMRNRLAVRSTGSALGEPGTYFSSSCPNAASEIENLTFAQPRVGEYATDKWEAGALDHAFDDITYGYSELDMPHGKLQALKVKWSSG
jgi:hypothetical protein